MACDTSRISGARWVGSGAAPLIPYRRIVDGPTGISPESARTIFPSSRAPLRDTCGTPLSLTARRAAHSAPPSGLPESGAVLWVLALRSDSGASAAQQCTIARKRTPRRKSSTCISHCRTRIGTILDAPRDQFAGDMTAPISAISMIRRFTERSPSSVSLYSFTHARSYLGDRDIPWRTACNRLCHAMAFATRCACRYPTMDTRRTTPMPTTLTTRAV